LRRGDFKKFLGLPIVVGGVGAGLVLGEGVRTGLREWRRRRRRRRHADGGACGYPWFRKVFCS
jgi:hypothetical protein